MKQIDNHSQIMKYQTRQKQTILNLFKDNDDRHLTVEEIKSLLDEKGEVVSIATIYRKVDELAKEGLIQKIVFDNTSKACYQYKSHDDCMDHFHLICEKCGKLIHMDCDEVEHIVNHISKDHNFKVNKSRVSFYGICDECRGKK